MHGEHLLAFLSEGRSPTCRPRTTPRYLAAVGPDLTRSWMRSSNAAQWASTDLFLPAPLAFLWPLGWIWSDGLTPRAAWLGRSRSEERRVGKECRSRWSPAQ